MDIESQIKKEKAVKITISINAETLDKLKRDKEIYNIPISTNITKSINELEKEREINKLLKQQISQTNLLLMTSKEKIETAELQKKEYENLVEKNKTYTERYQRFKQRNYFQRVMSVIFCLDD